ncbi:neuroblast differentiation-associated protein AHNAK isoform X5 [Mustelus asterias]
MAKKEDDLDVLLPNWSGAAAHGFSISGGDEGIFIKDVVQNSPAGKSGMMKEGDQIVSATIYFDDMGYEDAQKILQTVDRHTVGLKLHRKGEKLSPGGSYSWNPERIEATSPDAVLSGDDEDYQRIFQTKIKPRLKSEDGAEASDQGDRSSNVHITRKVITRTIHTSGPTVVTDMDIQNPEFKIKVPRFEQVTIERSGQLEAPEMDADINLPSTEGLNFQMDGQRTTHTMHIVKTKVVEVTGPDTEHSQATFRMPQINIAGRGGAVQTSEFDVMAPKATVKGQVVDISPGGAETVFSSPKVDADLNISGNRDDLKGPKIDIQTSRMQLDGSRFNAQDGKLNIKTKTAHFNVSGSGGKGIPDAQATSKWTKVEGPDVDIGTKLPEAHLKLSGPKIEGGIQTPAIGGGIKGPDVKMPGFSVSGRRIKTPDFDLDVNGTKSADDVDAPNFKVAGGITGPTFEMPELGVSTTTMTTPDINLQQICPRVERKVGTPDINLHGDIKGPKFNISGSTIRKPEFDLGGKGIKLTGAVGVPDVDLGGEFKGPDLSIQGPKADIKGPDVKGSGLKFSMPSITMPSVNVPDINLNLKGPQVKGDHDIDLPSADIQGEIKGPKVDVDVPEAHIKGPSGRFHMPHVKLPRFGMGGGTLEGPDLDIDANLPEGDVKLTGPQIEGGVDVPDVDLDVRGGSGKIKGPSLEMPDFNISKPKIKKPELDVQLKGPKLSGGIDVPEVNLGTDLKGPDVNIKGPNVGIEGPDVKGSGLKFSMPSINLPSVNVPDFDWKLKDPKLKGGHDIDLPSADIQGEIKGPKVDVDVPEADIKGPSGRFHMPHIKLPRFGMGGGKLDGPDLDIDANLPEGDVKLTGPQIEGGVDMPDVDLDVGGGKIKGPKVQMPDFNISQPKFKKPELDVQLKGPKLSGNVDVPEVNLGTDLKGPDVNMKGPNVDLEGPDVKGSGLKFSMPSINLPSVPDFDWKLKGPKLKGDHDIDLPSADIQGEIKGPKVDVDVPEADIKGPSGRFQMPKFRMPKFGMGGGTLEGPDLNIDANLPEGDVKLTGPQIEGGVDVPDVDLDVGGGSGKIKGPTLKMPEFHVSGPNIPKPDFGLEFKGPKLSGDVDVPDVNLDANIKGPDVNIKGPKADIEGPDVKGGGMKFSMPSITMPKIKTPDFDLRLKGPKLKGGHDIDLPSADIQGEIKGPKVDVDVPEADIKGPSGRFHMPHIKLPRFGMGGGKLEGPDLDIDANLPEGDVKLTGPQIGGGVDGPDVDLDVGGGKIRGPKVKMPDFNISGPRFKKPELDVQLKGPKLSGGVDVPEVNLGTDLKGPDVNMKGPNVDLEGPDVKGSGLKFSMPSINLPSVPDFDWKLKGPKLKGDHDIDLPSADIQGEIKGPKVDVDVPEADIKGPSGRFQMPKFRMPKFGIGGGTLEGPDLNIDANLPEGDVKLTGPHIEGGVDVPDVDLDVGGGSGKIKGPKVKMPDFKISGPKFKKPELDVQLKGPKLSGDVDVPEVNLGTDLKGPDVNIKGPNVDLEGPDVKGSGLKFSMPSINLPSVPDFDWKLKGPKLKGDHDIDLPSADIQGEIKGPKVDVDVPEADIKGPSGRFHMPKFRMPKFGMGGGTLEGPDLNIDANLPEGDVKLTGPQIEGGVDVPDVDLDVAGGSGKIKGPRLKMPEFHISGPKIPKPDFGLELKGPKLSGDVDVPDVNLDANIKGPDVNIKGPKADIEGPDVKGGGIKFSMPSITMPKIKTPDFDLSLKGPKLKSDHDIDLPSADIQGEIKGPKVDVDVPEADIKGPSGRFHMPHIKLPKFGMGGGKLEGPDLDIDANLPEGDVKLTRPQIGGGVDVPDVDLDVGGGKIKGPKVKMPDFNISGPRFKKPELDVQLKGPKLSGGVDVPEVNLGTDLKGPDVNMKGPNVDLEGPDVKGSGLKFSMPSINLPSVPDFDWKLKGPKLKGDHDIDLPSADIQGEIKGPKVDVDVPEADIKGPSGRFQMPKFRMPKFGMGGGTLEGPDLNIDANLPEGDVKLTGPQIEGGVDVPDVDLDVGGGSGKIKGPKVKMPDFKITGPKFKKPELDVQLKGPKLSGDVDVPEVNLGTDLKGPDVNIKGPNVDLEGPDVKGSGLKFSMPSINLPSVPDFDWKLKGPKLKGDHDIDLPSADIQGEIKGPKVDVDVPEADIKGPSGRFQMPKFRMPKFGMGGGTLEGPDLNIDANLPEGDVKLTGPQIEGGVDVPDVDLDVAGGSGKIKGPKVKMPDFKISGPKFKKPELDVQLKGPKLSGDVDVPEVNLGTDLKGPDVNIKGPNVDLEGPDVKGSGLKFSMPSINLPSVPDFDWKLKGPKLKGDHDIDLPSADIQGEIKGPKVDVDVPEADIKGPSGRFHMPKFRMPKFGMGGGTLEGPDLNIDANLPEGDVKLTGPQIEGGVDVPDVDLDVAGGSGKIKGPRLKMPEFHISGPKIPKPDFGLELKGPKLSGDVDVPDVNLDANIKGPDVNVKGPKADIEGPDVKGGGIKFSMPSITMPKIKTPDFDLSLKGPKLKSDHDIDLPSADIQGEIKGPKVDVDVPEADIKGPSGRFHMPHIKLPRFGMGGGKLEGPDLDIDANLPEGDVKLTGPQIGGGVDGPDVDLDVGGGKIKGPKVKMPDFNISGPRFKKPELDVQLKGPKLSGGVDAPEVNLGTDLKGPDVNIKGPNVDLEGPDVKGSGLKFSMPSINLPSVPDFDWKLKGPKLKGDHDIDLPSADIQGEIKGPKVDFDVPQADIKGPSGKFHMPKFRMPKFGMGGGTLEGPDLNIDANLPEGDVKLTGPHIEGGVDVPDVDLEVGGGSGKIKGPKVKMPDFKISGPKFKKPELDVQLKGPKLSGDVDVPDVNLDANVKGPDVNIKGPNVDLEGPDVKGSGLKFSMPSINLPSVPDFDWKLKGPKLKGDHDIDLPSADIQGEIKGPKVDVDVPEADIKGPSGKFHMPRFRMPKFGMGGGTLEGPDLNIDANLPEGDVKLTGPQIGGGVDGPDVDLDVGGGKIKGPKVKMPDFNISGPRFKKPELDVQLKGPKLSGNVDAPEVNLGTDLKGPDVNIKGPNVDLEGPDVKGSGLKFSMPSINLPSVPDFDWKLKGPKLKGGHDIDLPSADIQGEIKGPKVDVDVPEADIKGPSGRFQMPKFRMPKFGMGGGTLEGPDLNIDANLPEGDVKLTGPQIEGGVDVPDVDLDVAGGSGKIKGPRLKMPEFHISGPKIPKPDFGLELKGPKLSGDVDVPDVNLDANIKGPDVNVKGPKADIEGPDVKGGGIKFSMPSITMPKIKTPDFDLSLKGPKLKSDHDIDLPSADIQGEIKGPKVDVDVPQADIKGPSGRFHMPHIKLPRFGMGGGKLEGPDLDIDANLPEGDVKLTGPQIGGGVDGPDVDLDVGGGKIKGPKVKMPDFNISGPRFKKPELDVQLKGPKLSGNVDVPEVNLGTDLKGPDVNIKGPNVDLEGPDVKGSGLKFSMPSINLPSVPDFDWKLKGPKLKGGHDIDLPSADIQGEIKGPKVDVDVPEADIKGPSGRFHMPHIKLPKFGMGGGTLEGPDLNIDANLPEGDVKLTGPQIEGGVDVPDVDLDVGGGSGKIKGPKVKMPDFKISGPKFKKPELDVQLKGPKLSGDVDVPDVNLDANVKGPDVNIKGPNVDLEGPDVKGSGLKFSMPSINLPSVPDFDWKLKGPKLKGDHDIDLPSADIQGEIKGPKVDVGVPEADIKGPSGKFHMPKFRMPKFGMGGGTLEGPDLNIDANLPEGDVKLTGPQIEGGVDVPDVDLDFGGRSGKIKGPTLKMPDFHITGPKIPKPDFGLELRGPKLSGDVDVPDVNLDANIKGPDVNIKGPKAEIEGPDVKGGGIKFSMPSITMPKIKSPDLDLSLQGPKLKGNHDLDLPSATIEGEIKGPKVNVDVPDADIKAPKGRFHMPKFRMPRFGMGGGKLEGPDLDIDANLPEGDVKLSGSQIEGGVDVPDVDLDVGGGSGKIKGPKIKMPDLNISGGKFKKPDLDFELKGPKLSGGVDVPDVNLGTDLKGPDVNIKGPNVDLEGPDVKGSGLKFSMPSINLPSVPDFDWKLKGPKLKGDHDIDLPSADIQGEIKGPRVDVDVPQADIKAPKGRFHMPKFKLPRFGMGGGKLEGPDLDIDANLPEGDVKLTGPQIEGGVDVPDVDLDVGGGSGKIKGPKFRMPDFHISGPKITKPDFGLEFKGPKLSGDVDIPDVNLDANVKGPDVNIKGPKADIEGPDVKGGGMKFSMPSITMPKIKSPDFDLNLQGPKLKGDHDIDLPSVGLQGEIKGPKVDVDVPEADIKGPGGRFHMPHIKLPRFGMGGGKLDGPDLDIDANLPEGDVKFTGPQIEGGVDVPDVDLDVGGGSGKIKGPKFRMPDFHISGPKISKPDFGLEFKGPKLSGDVDVPDVNLDANVKGADVNIKGPKADIEGPDVKGGGMKFSMPSITMPKIKTPDFDMSLKGPKWKGDHDIDLPSADIQGEIKGPKVDVDVPEADIKGPSGRFHMPHIKLPRFGMGGGKLDGPDLDIDANLPEGDVKLTGPQIEGGVDVPDVDLDVGGGKIKGPKVKMPDFNISGPRFKKPELDVQLKGPKLSGNVDAPEVNLGTDLKGPDVNIKGPNVDLEGPDVKGSGLKFSMPSINLPSVPDFDWKLKGPKLKGDHDIDLPSADIQGEIKGPKVDVDVPEADIKGPSGRFHMPHIKLPRFGMGGGKLDGPDLDIDANLPEGDVNLTGPHIEGGVDVPDVDLDVGGGSGKIKGPKFRMPDFHISGPKISKPDFGLEFKGPKLSGDVDVPDINLDANVKGPDVNIKGPKADIESPDVKGGGMKFSMPSITMPKIKSPDFDLNLQGPKLKGDHDIDLPSVGLQGEIKGPKVDVDVPEADIKGPSGRFHMPKFRMPKFGMGGGTLEGPDLDIDANLPEGDVKLTGPQIEGGVDVPDVDLDVGGGSGKIKGPTLKMPDFHITGPKIPKPDFGLELRGPKLSGDVDVPDVNLDANIKGPDVNIKGPKADIEGPDVKGSGLKFSMPSINLPSVPDFDWKLKGPKLKGDHDIDLPSADIQGEIKGPKVDVDVPEADIKGPSGRFQMPKFRMPKFGIGGPKLEGPDLDIDASLPEGDAKLTGPQIEGGVDVPDVDLDVGGGSGKIKGPKFRMPEFHISGPKIPKPDFGLEFKGPKLSGDVDVPDVSLDGDLQGPKLKKPGFSISALKIPKPDLDLELKGPKLSGDVEVPDIHMEHDIKGQNLNIKGPKVDIEGPGVKGSGPTFSMPSIHFPNIKAPDFDLNLKGPKVKGDQNIDISSPNIEGEIKGPKIDVETPDVDLEGAHGQFRMPKIKMPTFKMGGSKLEGPDLDIDATLPGKDVNITGPKMKGGVDVPEIDVNAHGGVKGPGYHMPGINISMPKIKPGNFDLGFKGPGGSAAADISVDGDIKGPNVDLKGPKVDIEGPDAKGNGHKFSLPSLDISAPNISSPDMNFDLKGPNLEGNAEVKSPNLSLDVSAPEMDIDGQGAHLKMPKIKKPKFGFGIKGPQGDINAPSLDISGADVDLNVDSPDMNVSTKGKKGKFKMPRFNIKSKKPAGDVKVTTPKSDLDLSKPDIDMKSPDLNVSLGSSDGQLNIKPSKVKKPRFGKMKLSFPDVEFDLASPKFKGELPSPKIEGDLQAPNIDVPTADMKGPHVDIRTPGIDVNTDVDMEGPGFKAKGTKLKLPSVNIKMPKMPEPNLDINLKGANLKGEVSGDVKGPAIDIKRPEIDFDVDAPNVDIDKPEGKLKMKMKKPKFNISAPKFKGSGVDVDINTPKLEGGIKGPDINVDAPNLHLKGTNLKGDVNVSDPTMACGFKGPNVNLDTSGAGVDGKLKMPTLKLSGFGVDPKATGPDMDVAVSLPKADLSGPKLEGDINVPAADIKIGAPGVNIDGYAAKVKGSGFEMPSLKLSGPKLSSSDVDLKGDIKAPKIDMKGPGLDFKSPGVNFEGAKGTLKMPEFNVSGSKDSDLNFGINAPKIGGDLKTPGLDVNLGTPDVGINADGKFKAPQIAMPSVGISAPKLDLDLKNPQLKGDVNISSPNIKGDFRGPDVDVKGPNIDLGAADIDIKGGGGKLKMPQIKMKGVSAPDFNISGKGPKLEGNLAADLSGPNINTDIKGPKVDIKGPDMKMGTPDINFGGLKGKGPSVEFNVPKFEGGMKGDINVGVPDVNLRTKVKGPEVKIPTADVKLGAEGPTMKGVGVSGFKGDVKTPDVRSDIKAAIADLDVPLDKMTIPKFKHSQFQIKGPSLEGPQMTTGVSVSGQSQSASVSVKGPQASVSLPEGEVESSGVKVKKGKIKLPKFNFSKSKGKSSVEGAEGEFSVSGPKVDIKGPKGSLGFGDVEVEGGEVAASGRGSGLDISTSPKGKSGTLDFSLFKGKKSERHRSSSLSDEHEGSPTSPKGRLEFGEGAVGAKGKKSKLKFGTFGGFGAKSKGSYEVTLGEGEAAGEGSGISLVSKKSRLSSSSSSESGSRAGFRLPKVEVSLNKNKE